MATRRGERREDSERLERRFEDLETLQGLLEIAGAAVDAEEVLRRFHLGRSQGESPQSVIPGLFDEEPRFPDPSYARKLYSNLFGLWDTLAAGRPVPRSKDERTARARNKPARPEPPPPFDDTPDRAWVDTALAYLSASTGRERQRLEHAFENREDALLSSLDESLSSDEAYLHTRKALWELFALLELGRPRGAPAAPGRKVPEALLAHATQALEPLGQTAERQRAQTLVEQALRRFWET